VIAIVGEFKTADTGVIVKDGCSTPTSVVQIRFQEVSASPESFCQVHQHTGNHVSTFLWVDILKPKEQSEIVRDLRHRCSSTKIGFRDKYRMKISLVIPIGGICPYFVHTNLANVAETCGAKFDEFDFVFLTSKGVPDATRAALNKAAQKYRFRVLESPFHSLHLSLIDWAMRSGGLSDWVFLQHMDAFWKPGCVPWLKVAESLINDKPDTVAVACDPTWSRFELDHKPVPHLHDYVGLYNRKELVSRNWFFIWGPVKRLKLSLKVRSYIDCQRIRNIFANGNLDGSEAITLEAAVNCPELIQAFPFSRHVLHPKGSFGRAVLSIRKVNDLLFFDVPHSLALEHNRSWAIHSLISSCHYNLEESDAHIFPWKVFSELFKVSEAGVRSEPIFKVMSRYETPEKVLGTDSRMGIQSVQFKDRIIGSQTICPF